MIVLTLFSFASCNSNPEVSNGTGSITLYVSDAISKTIAYQPENGGPARITHYSITVENEKGDVVGVSDYMSMVGGSGNFQVNNLLAGRYDVNATGYIFAEDEYVPIAKGSAEVNIAPSESTDVLISLDKLYGSVDYDNPVVIKVFFPEEMIVDNTISGELSWRSYVIRATGFSGYKSDTIILESEQLIDGSYELTISTFNPNRYYIVFEFNQNDKEYRTIEAVIVYNGLTSTGSISFDTLPVYNQGFVVSDGLGGPINDITAECFFDASDETFTVILNRELKENENPSWMFNYYYPPLKK